KIRELLAAGTPVDERDEGGTTPLMVAAMYSLANIFQALLKAGADPIAVDRLGGNGLPYAATHATPAMLQELLEKNPDVNARNSRGETPLMGALTAKVMQLLLDAGADVHVRRNDGLTALDLCEIAVKAGFQPTTHAKIVELLRAAGAG